MAPAARRYFLLLAMAVASFSYSAPTWAAADDTLGTEIMSASVSGTGNLHHGTAGVSVARQSTGSYYVTFPRSIASCTCAANLGGVDGNTDYVVTWFVNANCPGFNNTSPDPTVAHVYTSRNAGSFIQADADFHLLVFCPN